MSSVFDLIAGSYVAIYSRAADPQGALFWANALGYATIADASAAQADLGLADALGPQFYAASSMAFDTLYPNGMLDSDFINDLYINLGGLAPDTGGATFWGNRLTTLEATNGQQVARSILATEIAFTLQTYDPNATGDSKVRADTYKNKLAVSEAIANTGNPVFNPVSQNSSDPAYAAEVNAVSHVDGTPASLSGWLNQIHVADAANNPVLLLPVGGPDLLLL
ncbi:MAG: hypothetical protein WBO09_18720 [Methylocystis silviterrae]|uniref:DUF4214 domain-containing protein n=1 Tax=Methylocystis silviterrae TaxID=2743612 RepID=UPI003BD2EA4A